MDIDLTMFDKKKFFEKFCPTLLVQSGTNFFFARQYTKKTCRCTFSHRDLSKSMRIDQNYNVVSISITNRQTDRQTNRQTNVKLQIIVFD